MRRLLHGRSSRFAACFAALLLLAVMSCSRRYTPFYPSIVVKVIHRLVFLANFIEALRGMEGNFPDAGCPDLKEEIDLSLIHI